MNQKPEIITPTPSASYPRPQPSTLIPPPGPVKPEPTPIKPDTASDKPNPSTIKPEPSTPKPEASTTKQQQEVPQAAIELEPVKNQESNAVTDEKKEEAASPSTVSVEKIEEIISPGKIKVQIIEGPLASVPGEHVADANVTAQTSGVVHTRKCGNGYARDQKGRCRRVRKPGGSL